MTDLVARAHALGLHGLALRFEEVAEAEWLPWLLQVEEEERSRRSLERRLRTARLGRFKSLSDFDWGWPSKLVLESTCRSATERWVKSSNIQQT